MIPSQRPDGRFQPRYDPLMLLEIAGAVAAVANPQLPAKATQEQYDNSRYQAGYADALTAKQTAHALSMSWKDVLALATDPTRHKEITIGRHLGEDEEDLYDASVIRAALKTVALRLGKKTLLPADYLAERERILESARRRYRHGQEPLLPTEGQILRIAGSWDEALEMAGLKPRPRNDPTHTGVPIQVALELALESLGALPNFRELEAFAKANNFSLANKTRPWADDLADLRAARADWGKWTPAGPAPLAVRPDFAQAVKLPASFDPVRRRRHRWTKEDCVAALARLLGELQGERLTQRLYQQKARADDRLPALTSLQRHGSFSALIAEARKQRRS